jgi:uncharacterized protein (DUF1501 family)
MHPPRNPHLDKHAAANPDRRRWLSAALCAPWAALSVGRAGATTSSAGRLVLVILRGGLDGLGAVPAIGDPDFGAARGALAQFGAPPLPLDATFALHPRLTHLHALYTGGELVVAHAVGLAYRERSHFDAQQVLESGGEKPYQLGTGWLARALLASAPTASGVALQTSVPLVLRGASSGAAQHQRHAGLQRDASSVDTWAPSTLPEPSADLVARLERLYAGDAALHAALARAKALHGDLAAGGLATAPGSGAVPMAATSAEPAMAAATGARAAQFSQLASKCAEFLAGPSAPRAAVLELGGWDTHVNQANPTGALATNLGVLDAGLAALRAGLRASGLWKQSLVVVASEFGREVAINGTQGSDHGSGGAAFALGGALRGGRVIADWPGLARNQRFEGRDLRTTTDLRGVLKGALRDAWGLGDAQLDHEVFPGSAAIRPLQLMS